jgi:two-component system nitrate/nitrite response regulator NarL
MTGSARARLLLVDDHHLVVEGLKSALREHFDVLAIASTAAEALRQAGELQPDAILLDLGLPDRSGLELIPDLRAAATAARILVVSMHTDRALAESAIQAGAAGFVPKDAGMAELCVAVGEVLQGRRYLSTRLTRRHQGDLPGDRPLGFERLTPRQQQIVRMIGAGRNSVEIAKALHLSPYTVAFHRKRIRKALGIDTELAFLRYAFLVQVGSQQVDAAPETP